MTMVANRQDATAAVGMLGMIVNKLLRVMERQFKCFPRSYLVVDLETTGLNRTEDLIGQIGYCVVTDRKPVKVYSTFLNWFRHAAIEGDWLRRRLTDTKYQVEHDSRTGAPSGKTYCLSPDVMMSKGEDPVTALALCQSMLEEARAQGQFVICHNGYNFDCPFLENAFKRFLGSSWKFGDNEVFDTGMVEKASQINLMPWAEEDLRAFSVRVGKQRALGVKWALDGHCASKYRLGERLGVNVAEAHEAGMDALMTHHLFEIFRDMSEGRDSDQFPRQPVQGPGPAQSFPAGFDPFPPDSGS